MALSLGDETLERALDPERSHASDCLAHLAEMIEARGRAPRDVERVIVGTGPGSYTGLRIGIATALGLARGAEAQLRGEPSGEALMWRELEPGEEGVYLLDARQGELYFSHYRRSAANIEVVSAPAVVVPGQVAKAIPASARVFGDELALDIAELTDEARSRFHACPPPTAGALLDLGTRRFETEGAHEHSAVMPLYLRPFRAKTRRR